MNKTVKLIILGAAAVAVIATSFEFASARDRYRRHHYSHDNALAAGVLGLGAGLIIGEALSRPRVVYEEPVYIEREPELIGRVEDYDDERDVYVRSDRRLRDQTRSEDYFPEQPSSRLRRNVSQGSLEPWTAEWRAYCADRYQSFNPRTGTYRGYDSQDHFCVAG